MKLNEENQTETIVNEPTGQEYSVGELENSNRIQKSVTPKFTLDWYIKWFSSILVLIAITIRSSGVTELHWLDLVLSWLGAVGWFIVGFMWKDRAVLLLNGVVGIILFGGILKYYFGV